MGIELGIDSTCLVYMFDTERGEHVVSTECGTHMGEILIVRWECDTGYRCSQS